MSDEPLSPGGPDSDLLFDALAHQLGFVGRDELVRALEHGRGSTTTTRSPPRSATTTTASAAPTPRSAARTPPSAPTSRHAAAAQAEALLRGKAVGRKLLYETACAFALAAKAAGDDATRPADRRGRESSRLAARAVALLEQAREKHLFDSAPMREHVLKDDDLAFLHGRDDFRAFLRRIEKE